MLCILVTIYQGSWIDLACRLETYSCPQAKVGTWQSTDQLQAPVDCYWRSRARLISSLYCLLMGCLASKTSTERYIRLQDTIFSWMASTARLPFVLRDFQDWYSHGGHIIRVFTRYQFRVHGPSDLALAKTHMFWFIEVMIRWIICRLVITIWISELTLTSEPSHRHQLFQLD